VARAVS